MKKIISLILLFPVMMSPAFAQVEMADVMRSNGKIYVVLGVALIVMLGMIIYMFMLDRKISLLEKKLKSKSVK